MEKGKIKTFESRTLAGVGLQRSNHLRSHGISTSGMPLSMKTDNRHLIAIHLAHQTFQKDLEKRRKERKKS